MDKEDAVYVYIMEHYSAIPNTLLNQSASAAVIRVKGDNISKSWENISTRPESQMWLVPSHDS